MRSVLAPKAELAEAARQAEYKHAERMFELETNRQERILRAQQDREDDRARQQHERTLQVEDRKRNGSPEEQANRARSDAALQTIQQSIAELGGAIREVLGVLLAPRRAVRGPSGRIESVQIEGYGEIPVTSKREPGPLMRPQ